MKSLNRYSWGGFRPVFGPLVPFTGGFHDAFLRDLVGTDLMGIAPGGIEPPTSGLGNRCSILLSYGAKDLILTSYKNIGRRKWFPI